MPDPGKVKRITVHYLKKLEQPDLILETAPGGRAGHFAYTDEKTGAIAGYRLYADKRTVIVPLQQVADIELDL